MNKTTKAKANQHKPADNNPHFYADVLARSLQRIGLPKFEAYGIAHKIWEKISHQKKDAKEIKQLVEKSLRKKYPRLLKKYRTWQAIMEESKPVILLIGGGTGIGTSTLAMRLAWLLEINHIISTDSVREVVRQFIPENVLPTLHVSTYQAGTLVHEVKSKHDRLLDGFITQCKPVLSGIEAIVERAITEKCSTVVEGIHLIPGEMEFLDKYKDDAIVIQIMLDVNQKSKHLKHINFRSMEDNKRDKTKYLKHFKEIRLIRDYLVDQAIKNHMPVIQNYNYKKAEKEILDKLFLSYVHKK